MGRQDPTLRHKQAFMTMIANTEAFASLCRYWTSVKQVRATYKQKRQLLPCGAGLLSHFLT